MSNDAGNQKPLLTLEQARILLGFFEVIEKPCLPSLEIIPTTSNTTTNTKPERDI